MATKHSGDKPKVFFYIFLVQYTGYETSRYEFDDFWGFVRVGSAHFEFKGKVHGSVEITTTTKSRGMYEWNKRTSMFVDSTRRLHYRISRGYQRELTKHMPETLRNMVQTGKTSLTIPFSRL